jgi:hypothetical protein
VSVIPTALSALVLLANQPTLVLVMVGASLFIVVALGILRLLAWLPQWTINLMGRRGNPVVAGIFMIALGGAAKVFAVAQ